MKRITDGMTLDQLARELRPFLYSAPTPGGTTDHGSLLGLSDDDHTQYLNTTRHTAIGDSAPHHAAVTLDVNADTLLSLSTQALGLDVQSANLAFVGPATGAAAVPTFRALVAADLPAATELAQGAVELATVAEVKAGTDTTRAVTAAGVAGIITLATPATDGKLTKSGVGVLTLAAADVYTLTVGATSAINQDVQTTASPTFANVQIPDAGYVGIASNERLVFNAAGTIAITGASLTIPDGQYVGVTSDVRIKFDGTSGYIDHILGDAAGSDKLRVVDSAGVDVTTINSDGLITTISNVLAQRSGGNVSLIADTGSGTNYYYSSFVMRHAGLSRWQFYKSNDADGDLYFARYNDGGTFAGAILRANRATGYTSIGHANAPTCRLDVEAGAVRWSEMTAPSSPAANSVLVYAEDDGTGKTRLMALFATGAAQQIAIQP